MRLVLSSFVVGAACVLSLAAQDSYVAKNVKPPPAKVAKGFADIVPEDCHKWLSYLAGEECEGRGTGQDGYQKAADFVAKHFKEFGLAACGDKDSSGAPTYFQQVPFVTDGIDPESCVAEFSGPNGKLALKIGEGFGVTGRGKLEANAPLVVLAASAGERTLPVFDVVGKIVLVLGYGEADGTFPETVRFLTKLNEANPAAVLRINEVRAARGAGEQDWVRKDQAGRMDAGGGRAGRATPRAPSVFISKDNAEKICTAAGQDMAKLVSKARSTQTALKTTTNLRVKLAGESKRKERDVPNVVGFLEGSDPALNHELVIFGSHLDHLGRGADGKIYPGADDDGSGSAGLMAIARAFARNTPRPKRSVMFIAVCGEEKGLLGSEWYVEHPLFPLKNTVAEIQVDMIGRREEAHPTENPGNEKAEDNLNSLHLVGSKRISTELHEIFLKQNAEHVGFDFEWDGEKYYTRSDHYNFAKKGIPVGFLFTGVHRDYHQTTDTIEKIDFPKLARVAQLVYLVGYDVADRPKRIVSDVKPGKAAPQKDE